MQTIEILGTPLALTDYDALIAECVDFSRRDQTTAIDFTNTHIVTMRRADAEFRQLTDGFDYFIPDGMPLIWCLNQQGAGLRDRVYGPTFMRRCLVATPAQRHYFLGGSRACLQQLKTRMLALQPQLEIVAERDGYFSTEAEPKIVDEINRLAPDFIWIGLGTPKQQDWIFRNRVKISRGVLFAVGFAFDVNAGTKEDAPLFLQKLGLTWLFRIVQEPRRLLTRYLKYNSLFVFYLVRDALLGAKR